MELDIKDQNGKTLYSDSVVYWGSTLNHFEIQDGEVVLAYNPPHDHAFYYSPLEWCKRECISGNFGDELKLVKTHATMNEYDEIMKRRCREGHLD